MWPGSRYGSHVRKIATSNPPEQSVLSREKSRDVWYIGRRQAANAYWHAEAMRLRTLWWLQDWAVMPIARRSAARWTAGKSVPGWWRAFLILLLTRADD